MSTLGTAAPSGDSWGTYRAAGARRIVWAICGFFALIGVAGLIQPSLDDRLMGLVWLCGVGLCARLSARLRVSTGPDGVTIVGMVRTRRLSWRDVDRFALVEGQGYLVTNGGGHIMLGAIGGLRYHVREQERLVAALDADLARARRQQR